MAPPKLFTPLTLGGKSNRIELKHRVVMAPLTRLRAGDPGVQPSIAATYYGQRATDGGLIIAEATNISPTARGYYGSPGIFHVDQVSAWKQVTNAAHAKGGKIFLQLWHTGRVSHPLNQPNGELPVTSSPAPATFEPVKKAATREGRLPFVAPRPLETHEIPSIVQDYRTATENALAAGFDGVELHAANGYLLEQFLCDPVNQRTDQYGGSLENRARFLFEALEGILQVAASSQVGIRLSPCAGMFGCRDSDPMKTWSYVVEKLNAYDLAYVHLIEPRGFHPPMDAELQKQFGNGVLAKHFRSLYRGVILTASGYERESAIQVTEVGVADAVVFGRWFISNPDLVKRLQRNAPLTPWDMSTFYAGEEQGYIDYPLLSE